MMKLNNVNMSENWDAVESDVSKDMRVWLQELTDVTSSGKENQSGSFPKVLFVLDNDYGELTTILYLILGQHYFRKSKLLLTSRLYEKNKNALPSHVEMWTTEEDLQQCIETYQPDFLVLAAGYLIPVHNLLTSDALGRICRVASDQKAKVITADPFLGLLSEWSPKGLEQIISIDIPTDAGEELLNVKQFADKKLHTELAAANSVLHEYLHLYPSYTDMKGIKAFSSDSKNRSFFNEKLLIPKALQAQKSKDKPHWIFIISEVDFQTQAMHFGVGMFASVVLNLLAQGANFGRKIIFLGPSSLIDILSSMNTSIHDDIHLFNFGAYDRVMALLLTAEYSFYWNVVSHTILIQLWNGRPVILLDKGHLARAVPNLYERVIAWYYQGWEPQYFDQNEPLSLEALAEFVSIYEKKKPELMNAYRRAPIPADLFNSFIEGSNDS